MIERRRVIITGSRDLREAKEVYDALYAEKNLAGGAFNLTVIHGDCPTGADRYAHKWCSWFPQVVEEKYPADWDAHGKAAGPIRNKVMVDLGADVVRAFPRGEARGTMNCVGYAKEAKIPVLYG